MFSHSVSYSELTEGTLVLSIRTCHEFELWHIVTKAFLSHRRAHVLTLKNQNESDECRPIEVVINQKMTTYPTI